MTAAQQRRCTAGRRSATLQLLLVAFALVQACGTAAAPDMGLQIRRGRERDEQQPPFDISGVDTSAFHLRGLRYAVKKAVLPVKSSKFVYRKLPNKTTTATPVPAPTIIPQFQDLDDPNQGTLAPV